MQMITWVILPVLCVIAVTAVGLFASLFHFDELNYGEQKQGNLNAIVTSGIAGWGYPIRTEKHSEYVVVNLIS